MDGTDEACCSAFFVKAECETEAFFFFFNSLSNKEIPAGALHM